MGDNSRAMTLEERLVQHIKGVGLAALIDDEDAITELTRRAVREALTQTRTVKDGSYHSKEVDSPVVEAAREIAAAAIKKIMADEVARMTSDEIAMKALREAIVAYLPQAVKDISISIVSGIMYQTSDMTIQRLKDAGLLAPNKFIPR